MKIIDWYILKRYLATFFTMLLLFIPIGILVDLSEKVDNMIEHQAPLMGILKYYLDFTIYYANFLFPIFLFLSVIWFTSKLANNTEIIAILSSGISFFRFFRPYMYGATIVAIFVFVMGMFIVPNASEGYNSFTYKYIKGKSAVQQNATSELYNQINDDEIIYVSTFNTTSNYGSNFTLEHFDGNRLEYKISADQIRWVEKDTTYRLTNYVKRFYTNRNDSIVKERSKDIDFKFKLSDFQQVAYVAETKNLFELNEFIRREKAKGSANVSQYQFILYKRWSAPVTAFILTLIAVAVSSMKRRGGMGVNLLFGIAVAFIFIFFDKVFGVLAKQSGLHPFIAVAIPIVVFGILAVYLVKNAKR